MRKFLLVAFCVVSLSSQASHIAGGELQLTYVSSTSDGAYYRLELIYYFDDKGDTPFPPNDQFNSATGQYFPMRVSIFRKQDNVFIENFQLYYDPQQPPEKIEYTQPNCSAEEDDHIKVYKVVYSRVILLYNFKYTDPDGYYITWERCCRNYSIVNIVSENPADFPGQGTGQVFYMEFPPLAKNGVPFINSSPGSFNPINDFACVGRPYVVDFSGIDPDGDSLVYTMVWPWDTHSEDAQPPLLPAPFDSVQWTEGFDLQHIMRGNPDLKITPDGILSVTPIGLAGTFAFAVTCEEFRDGVKIGEVRRDFQITTVDCTADAPPVVLGKKQDDSGYTDTNEPMVVKFDGSHTDTERCIQIRVSDPDSNSPNHGRQQDVTIKAIPLNFDDDVAGLLPDVDSVVLTGNDFAFFDICFDRCPLVHGPFEIGIIAFDDACGLPRTDTLRLIVNITPPDSSNVRFFPQQDTIKALDVEEGEIRSWEIVAVNSDSSEMFISAEGVGFDLASSGMSLGPIVQVDDTTIQTSFVWNTDCRLYDFFDKTEFDVMVFVDNENLCGYYSHMDTMFFKLKVAIPENAPPIIGTNLSGQNPDDTVRIVSKIYETFPLVISGEDPEGDTLSLAGTGNNFTLNDFGVNFQPEETIANISAPVDWFIDCNTVDISVKNKFDFLFLLMDHKNKCRFKNTDTLRVQVKVEPPDNTPPQLALTDTQTGLPIPGNFVTVTVGQPLALTLTGFDADTNPQDSVGVELVQLADNSDNLNISFAPAFGIASATANLNWTPDCSVFENGVFERTEIVTIRVTDNRCFNDSASLVPVTVHVVDIDGGYADFSPFNFVLADGDGCNDYFAFEGFDSGTCPHGSESETEAADTRVSLPRDNCAGQFQNVTIYNRWGKVVYTNDKRNFRWYAEGEAAGIYYYNLKYSHKEYKGIITVTF